MDTLTFDEWCRLNGYDQELRQYADRDLAPRAVPGAHRHSQPPAEQEVAGYLLDAAAG